MSSQFYHAVRVSLEPLLVCHACQRRNTEYVRELQILDAHGQTLCVCGRTGPVQDFLPDGMGFRDQERSR